MGEQQLFLEGHPPDFSLLQRLLCLEPEPCRPLLPPPSPRRRGDTGDTGTGSVRRGGVPEPVAEPRSPLAPPGAGLTFLQETARLLAPPEPPPAPPAAAPEQPGDPPGPPGGPDALSLISLQCRHLAGTGTSNGTSNGDGTSYSYSTGSSTSNGNGTSNGTGNDDGTGYSYSTSNGTDNGNGTGNGTSNGYSTSNSTGYGNGTGNSTGYGFSTNNRTGNSTNTSKSVGDGSSYSDGTSNVPSNGPTEGNGPSNAPANAPSPGTGTSGRRKAAPPRRGADPRDPSFRGVTLRLRLGPPHGHGAEGCCLLITARRHRVPPLNLPAGPSSSSEEDAPPTQGSKRCASCKTRRTPLWRAAENGTPLCNACGIRYKKYRLRCQRCWSVPGKSGTSRPQCPQCGERCHPAGGSGR